MFGQEELEEAPLPEWKYLLKANCLEMSPDVSHQIWISPTELGNVWIFNGQGFLFLSRDNFFSWLEISSTSATDMTSQVLGIHTIPRTPYST